MARFDPSAPRRRPWFGLSALSVLVLLFLPTLRVCGDPAAPLEAPPVYFPYVCSVLLGIAAFVTVTRWRRLLAIATIGLWGAAGVLLVGAASSEHAAFWPLTLASAAVVVVVVRKLLRSQFGELAVLVLSVVNGFLVLGWYALLAFDRDAMWGAYLGFGVAIVMTLSALIDLARYRRGDRRLGNGDGPLQPFWRG